MSDFQATLGRVVGYGPSMLRVRATDGPEGVAIEGDVAGFTRLDAVLTAGAGTIELDAIGDAAPYRRWLKRLVVIESTDSLLRYAQPDGAEELTVHLPAALRETAAWNTSGWALELGPGHHRHEEHHPDHPVLDERSIPVVIEHVR